MPARPDPGEEGEGLAFIQSEPPERFLGLRVFPLAETCPRHQASVIWAKPAPPVRRGDITDVRHAGIRFAFKDAWRCWHAPSRHGQLAALGSVAHDRRSPVRVDVGRRVGPIRQIRNNARELAHRFMARGDVVEIAHVSSSKKDDHRSL